MRPQQRSFVHSGRSAHVAHRARQELLGCPRWLLNICLAYYMFSPFINIVSTRLSHLATHVYHPYATMFRAFITMVR